MNIHIKCCFKYLLQQNKPRVATFISEKNNAQLIYSWGFPGGSVVRKPLANEGDMGSIPGWGRSSEGNGNPLQYSCLENPMDRGA